MAGPDGLALARGWLKAQDQLRGCARDDGADDPTERRGIWSAVGVSGRQVRGTNEGRGERAGVGARRDAAQVSSASLRIICSVSASGTSCSNVSSAEMDCVGRSGTTLLSSTPRANS